MQEANWNRFYRARRGVWWYLMLPELEVPHQKTTLTFRSISVWVLRNAQPVTSTQHSQTQEIHKSGTLWSQAFWIRDAQHMCLWRWWCTHNGHGHPRASNLKPQFLPHCFPLDPSTVKWTVAPQTGQSSPLHPAVSVTIILFNLRVSLCSLGCSKAWYIDHTGCKLTQRASSLCRPRVWGSKE